MHMEHWMAHGSCPGQTELGKELKTDKRESRGQGDVIHQKAMCLCFLPVFLKSSNRREFMMQWVGLWKILTCKLNTIVRLVLSSHNQVMAIP